MKLLIDKDMNKKDLMEQANISSFSTCKLNRGENVTIDALGKIYKAISCTLDDICEVIDKFEFTGSCYRIKGSY